MDGKLKFVDEIEIQVSAGKGGAGCVSFLHEKYREFGGPDGGDGGRGGDVWLEANPSMQSLGRLQSKRHWKAGDGQAGRGKQQSGRDGASITIQLPIGTEVRDAQSRELLCDLSRPQMRFCVARGGLGGRGNCHFATPTNQTPEYAQPGLAGEERELLLSLKLLADVGLVGLPNAGKSTLLAAVSQKLPKIADYAFTTLTPNIGVVEDPREGSFRRLLLADIPGILEGASKGVGLGLSFLRHIERVSLIVYVLDGSNLNASAEVAMLRNELASYSESLLKRPSLIALNKMDELDYDRALARESIADVLSSAFWKESGQAPPELILLSAKEGKGTDDFVDALFRHFPAKTLAERSLKTGESDAPEKDSPAASKKAHILIRHETTK